MGTSYSKQTGKRYGSEAHAVASGAAGPQKLSPAPKPKPKLAPPKLIGKSSAEEEELNMDQEMEKAGFGTPAQQAAPSSGKGQRAMANRPTAAAAKPKASFSGKPGSFNPFGKSIECPHCGEGISRGYAIKSLVIIAKSEGNEHLSEEIQALDEPDAEKAVTGKTGYVGNKDASHRGKAPGSFVSHPRTGGKQTTERNQRPTNPVTEGGMRKSLFHCVEGQPNLVEYVHGSDDFVAKSIEERALGDIPARNLRAEQEAGSGEATAE